MKETKIQEIEKDELFEEARVLVIEKKSATASLLQRKLSIGYARAARLIDELESEGIIGPANGAKPRKVFKNKKKPKKAKKKADSDLMIGDDEDEESESERRKRESDEEFLALNGSGKLTLKMEAFCDLYASSREFFGNGTQAYIEAYDINVAKPGAYNGARSSAYRLLTNAHILERINGIIEMRGLNDSFVDKQLEFLITQHADPKAKIAAIREYNNLKNRIKTKKDTVDPNGVHTTEYTNLSDEELDHELNKRAQN